MDDERNLLIDAPVPPSHHYDRIAVAVDSRNCHGCKQKKNWFCTFVLLGLVLASFTLIAVSHTRNQLQVAILIWSFRKFSLLWIKREIDDVHKTDHKILKVLLSGRTTSRPYEWQWTESTTDYNWNEIETTKSDYSWIYPAYTTEA